MRNRKQKVETGAFSSDFIALEECIEDIEQPRFKLRMFDILLSDDQPATLIFYDNESVCKNTSNVESTLNKKHSAIAYHFARWNMAAGFCTIDWIPTGRDLADAMTKILSMVVLYRLFGSWTY